MKWFTADLHFWHKRIIKICRPWAENVEKMNEIIISEINRHVQPHDELFILGDVSFANYERTLECVRALNARIRIVPGNHDNPQYLQRMKKEFVAEILPPLYEVRENRQEAVLCHFPLMSWNKQHYGSWNLHGHCHGNLNKPVGKQTDVGWDVWHRPVSWDELVAYMAEIDIEVLDHHNKNNKVENEDPYRM